MKIRPSLRLLVLTALCISTFATAAAGQFEAQGKDNGKSNKPINKIIHLQAVSDDSKATGIAKILLKTKGKAMQRFQVVGANLKSGATYTLIVDGQIVGSKTAVNEEGEEENAVEFVFAKKAKGKIGEGETLLPAELDPVSKIKHVELRDASNQVVLSGDFPE